jgi:ATP-dependent Lhr-like helicase
LELQALKEGRGARNPDDVHDLLRSVGDLTDVEIAARSASAPAAWISQLLEDGRAFRVRLANEDRLAAVEDLARLRDALGVSLPLGLPTVFTEPTERPLEALVARYARTHAPFLASQVATRLGAAPDRVRAALEALEVDGRVTHGEFRPGGVEREWCDVEVLRRLRRRSLAALRKEIEPVDAAAFGRFLPAWQGAVTPSGGPDALVDAIGKLQGAAVPASVLEHDVLAARVRGYRPADLDALCASGDLVWVGVGPLAGDDGKVALSFRDRARFLAPPQPEDPPDGPIHRALRERLEAQGASFWPDLVLAAGTADERVVLAALWDLVWAGEVTNDTLVPLRAFVARKTRSARSARPRPGALRRTGPPAGAGRWSLVSTLLQPSPGATEMAHARALQLLDRHGILTREAVLAEGLPGGFVGVYGVLKALEESGKLRRGYFVAGLGAAQFAVPGAVDRLRAMRDREHGEEPATVVLAATDPAQPYGAALPWPDGPGRPARQAGSFVFLAQGELAAYLERGARSLLTFDVSPDRWVDALRSLAKDGRLRRIELTRIDGVPAAASPFADALRAAGFADGYRGLIARA